MKELKHWVSFAFLITSLIFACIAGVDICKAFFYSGEINFYLIIIAVSAFMIHTEIHYKNESN